MTCIAGLVAEDGTVYMGADSAASAGDQLVVRADEKVFKAGGMIFGFAQSFRVGQVMRFGFCPPPVDGQAVDRYMVTTFVDAMRERLRATNALLHETATQSQFLVAVHRRLFTIDFDFQIAEALDGFAAIGSGAPVARGALHATRDMSPRERIRRALEAAESFSPGVRRPFVFRQARQGPPPNARVSRGRKSRL